VEDELVAGDLTAARSALRSLAGRDASELDESGIAAAVIESLAENSVDAVMASAFWGLVAGAPGVFAHRAVNTLDAMVGHHNARYENFGWAAARVDDAVAWAPARAYAALVAAATPRRAADVRRLVARDAAAHPSPNAGVAETAVAAALGRELGGPLRYGDRVEERPRLGDGPRPAVADIRAARALTSRAEWVLIGLLVLIGWTVERSGANR
jgi:adenosylcobinamide-phosphate synthase